MMVEDGEALVHPSHCDAAFFHIQGVELLSAHAHHGLGIIDIGPRLCACAEVLLVLKLLATLSYKFF